MTNQTQHFISAKPLTFVTTKVAFSPITLNPSYPFSDPQPLPLLSISTPFPQPPPYSPQALPPVLSRDEQTLYIGICFSVKTTNSPVASTGTGTDGPYTLSTPQQPPYTYTGTIPYTLTTTTEYRGIVTAYGALMGEMRWRFDVMSGVTR